MFKTNPRHTPVVLQINESKRNRNGVAGDFFFLIIFFFPGALNLVSNICWKIPTCPGFMCAASFLFAQKFIYLFRLFVVVSNA